MRFDLVDPGGLAVVRGKSPENRTRDDFDVHHCHIQSSGVQTLMLLRC